MARQTRPPQIGTVKQALRTPAGRALMLVADQPLTVRQERAHARAKKKKARKNR